MTGGVLLALVLILAFAAQDLMGWSPGDDRVFLYDTDTDRRLIAETDPGVGLGREYHYLLNDIRLAMIQ